MNRQETAVTDPFIHVTLDECGSNAIDQLRVVHQLLYKYITLSTSGYNNKKLVVVIVCDK